MLTYSTNTGLFLFEKHWILGMVYTIRTFHFKKRKKFISFKQYFNVFKFQNYLFLFSDGLNGSSASPIAPRNEKKVKTSMRNLLTRSFLTYDEFRLLELMITMRLRLCYRMLLVYSF